MLCGKGKQTLIFPLVSLSFLQKPFQMISEKEIFARAELLMGSDYMEAVAQQRVILFGVGGVGSWCAEGLIRSGIRHLTIVDSDRVSASNINRQLMATTKTVGRVKVQALKEHLLEINPEAEIIDKQEIFSAETAEMFELDSYDYIIDAIDSLENKAQLILRACATKAVFFSSMGAALKMDPSRVSVAEFWEVKGCPLGRALRQKFKKQKQFPKHKFKCVYSDELLPNLGDKQLLVVDHAENVKNSAQDALQGFRSPKAQTNGSLAHITAIFGFTLSGLVLKDIANRFQNK